MGQYDVVVIGGGPGGYSAAVRASQLGLKTALVENEELGGTCLNWGCIPTKSLLRNAEIIHLMSKGKTWGIRFGEIEVDYAAAQKRSREVVRRQTRRITFLIKNNNIQLYNGFGMLKDEHTVEIVPTGEKIHGKNIILATGSRPRELPGVACDGRRILSFRHALEMTQVPASVAIIGAGPIGMEFATLWNRFGAKVTVIELLPNILPLEDDAISIEAAKQFKRNGIKLKTGGLVQKVTPVEDEVEIEIIVGDQKEKLVVDIVLVAIGFVSNSDGIGIRRIGVATTKGSINVNDTMRTNIPHIYAIGDVNGKMGLAHVAYAQAVIAAEAIAGKPTNPINYDHIPRCTFSQPEIASVGLTEKQCADQAFKIKTAQCPFLANGKALAMDDNSGFVKIIADAETSKLIGVHMIGSHVTELIAGPTSLLELGATAQQLGSSIHPHPTLSENIMEAAHVIEGHAIHF